jgi:DUF4097 and DUF4098 domain-containing protein YvlB
MRRLTFYTLVALAVPATAAHAQDSIAFRWRGRVPRGQAIEVKGINGPVRAERASGDEVEVVAVRTGRRSDPESVRMVVVEHDDGVTVCAVYPDPPDRPGRWRNTDEDGNERRNECRPGDKGHMNVQDNDVRVDFTVRVPAGVDAILRTVNGSVRAESLASYVDAYTINGGITISTTADAQASTINGGITASLGADRWTGALDFRTLNGSIRIELPATVSARLRADCLNGGRITADWPLTLSERGSPMRRRRATATLGSGSGGGELWAQTMNGGIRVVRKE